MTTTNSKTAKNSSRTRSKEMTEEKVVVGIEAEDQGNNDKTTENNDDGLTEEEKAVLNGDTASGSNSTTEPTIDPKAALLALASSEIQGFGANFSDSVITALQQDSDMAASMLRQYPKLFYMLTLQRLIEGAEGGENVNSDLGKPVLTGGMQSGFQQFQTLMTTAQQRVVSAAALSGTVLTQLLPAQEENTL